MFRDNTVFIIGAGASHEFGLPVGEALMKTIQINCRFRTDHWTILEGIEPIYKCIVNRYTKDDDKIDARLLGMAEINRAIDHAGSIDEFINRHTGDEVIAEVGKIQIAYAILEAERRSKLATTPLGTATSSPSQLSDTWINSFTRMLFDGVRNSDVDNVGSNITIICFNYDRCIEMYLEHAIMNAFRDVSPDRARQIVARINIIHPYGSLGGLNEHPFGSDVSPQRLRQMSDNIVTWSESRASERAPKIQHAMANASTIVFLGFAFAPQNMRLLTVDKGFDEPEQEVETFATAYGYNPVINERLKTKILDLYSPNDFTINSERVHIQYEMKCAEFLRAHSMALVV